jgi:hypothetical protein
LYDSEASLRLVDHAIEGVLDRSTVGEAGEPDESALEATPGTIVATTDILDGLSRAVGFVDRLDVPDGLPDDQRREIVASLRDALSGLTNQLKFQDSASS